MKRDGAAMFKYFPKNYVWNLSVDLAIEMGLKMGEVEEMCAPLLEVSEKPDAEASLAFRQIWEKMANKLCDLAREDEEKGRLISAGEKYNRASTCLLTAERLQAHDAEGRKALYLRFLDLFKKGIEFTGENCEFVRIPYQEGYLSGLFVKAEGNLEKAPVLLQVNGLDSTKEMKYRVGLPQMLAKRGISSLIIDQPGTGDALRLRQMTALYNSEIWASQVVDYLQTRDDVDATKIGMEGVSLGGYYCPRAVAFEPRFACGVVWGANHDWREVQKRRLEKEGNFPVPHYWAHVQWVWGAKNLDDFMQIAENVHLDGILDRIKVPFLVTHGEQDSQIPLKWAERTYAQLTQSPKRELKIFTEREGGVQHSSFDNPANSGAYIADWVAETLGGQTKI